jgi:hypothetical protein
MARPFAGSVADVLARTRRIISKNPGNAAFALRRFRRCFRTPNPVCGDGGLELRRQSRNPWKRPATRGLPDSARIMPAAFILDYRVPSSVGTATYLHIR